jgi:hypothetical protein
VHENIDAAHGRIETRRCYLSTCLDTLPNAARWKGLKSIGMVESERIIHGKTSIDQRHYITTLTDVATFAHAARAHWGVDCLYTGFWMSPSKKMTPAFALDTPLKTLISFANLLTSAKNEAL